MMRERKEVIRDSELGPRNERGDGDGQEEEALLG